MIRWTITPNGSRDIADTQGFAPNYPLIADTDFAVSKAYGMLPADVIGDPCARTPADTGRNFDGVLRVIDSLQLTAAHRLATPAQWRPGADLIIAGSVSDVEARQLYPDGWAAPRPYLRYVSSSQLST